MPKLATLGNAKTNSSEGRTLENIDIKGNGPKRLKIWIYLGLALTAYFVSQSKVIR